MSSVASAYDRLHKRFHEIAILRSCSSLLEWDQETGMPPGGADWRATQLAWLSGRRHELITAPETADLLAEVEAGAGELAGVRATNVRGWRRILDREAKLPPSLVEEFARTTSLAQPAWAEARKTSDFRLFRPHLERIIHLCRERADAWGWKACRYDALLEEYEPGATTAELSQLMARLAPELSALGADAVERSARVSRDALAGHYPAAAQYVFNRQVAAAIGFDFTRGRIDTTTHPFCTSPGPGDVRLTTRYDESDFTVSLFGVLHEAGHGLYEQGLNAEEWGQPAGDSVSLGIHESQSRLWENHIGGSLAFWERWLAVAAQHFLDSGLGSITPAVAAAAAARVEPGFIRVEADEVTYDAHIVLRFELEQALISGDLSVDDLPGAWNERFAALLHLTVPDDARGCLQDIHWSAGLFGYFPTYTLGNLNAAQLMHAARQAMPDLDASLAAGEYAPLLGWLRENIHSRGQELLPGELIRQATGEPLQPRYFLDYLRCKFVEG